MFIREVARRAGVGRFLLRYAIMPAQRLLELRFPDTDVTLDIDGCKIKVFSPRKNRIGRAIYKERVWEPAVTSMVEHKTQPGMIALDVGADIGYYTLQFARLVGPAGRVVAFEPIPEARRRLEHNIAINGCGNITVSEYALGNQEGEVYLEDPLNTSRINLSKTEADSRDISVSIKRMDDYIIELDRPSVDIVKIDVEGAEHEVLLGMEQTLRRCSPDLIVEVHNKLLPLFGSSRDSLLSWLAELGYEFTPIDEAETEDSFTSTFFCHVGSKMALPRVADATRGS